jgi:hypothetical protein
MKLALHDKHMQLVDHVNASTTQQEYRDRGLVLQGFREYADFVNPSNTLRTWADLAVMDRGEKRPLCCGVLFWDYTNDRMRVEDEPPPQTNPPSVKGIEGL